MGIAEVWGAVWIGVMPGSLSGADGVVVASKCRAFCRKRYYRRRRRDPRVGLTSPGKRKRVERPKHIIA
jgi:hypothetical protein